MAEISDSKVSSLKITPNIKENNKERKKTKTK